MTVRYAYTLGADAFGSSDEKVLWADILAAHASADELAEAEATGTPLSQLAPRMLEASRYCWLVYRGVNGAPLVPFFIWGLIEVHPGVLQVWGYGPERSKRDAYHLTLCIREIIPELAALGWRRVQVVLPAASTRSIAWLRRLGFQHEGVLKAFNVDGSDAAMLAITRNAALNGSNA